MMEMLGFVRSMAFWEESTDWPSVAAVLSLVDEESGLLSLEPVDVELHAVLYGYVVGVASEEEAVFLLEVGFVGQGCL